MCADISTAGQLRSVQGICWEQHMPETNGISPATPGIQFSATSAGTNRNGAYSANEWGSAGSKSLILYATSVRLVAFSFFMMLRM